MEHLAVYLILLSDARVGLEQILLRTRSENWGSELIYETNYRLPKYFLELRIPRSILFWLI